ncbi:MAG: hypothetical protein A2Y12_06280 [Planctomycetes bacterium GWF2_42_9]|nr:MAG: hypothetical protein A2Y12_06280 [Planctomycetes bacterium GWF2_42_9]
MANKTKSVNTRIIVLLSAMFLFGILPWIFLVNNKTKPYIEWMGGIKYQVWGVFILIGLTLLGFKQIQKWNPSSKMLRFAVILMLVLSSIFSAIWLLLLFIGLISSRIV